MTSYPFEPRSNALLKPGQFWGIPLSDGRWAAGLVLGTLRKPLPSYGADRTTFMAALLDGAHEQPPTGDSIAGRTVVDHGWAHVLTIQENGRTVLGELAWGEDDEQGLFAVTHRGGGTVWLYRGASPVRPATANESASLPVLTTWGFDVIALLAERVLVKGLPIVREDESSGSTSS